MKEHYEHRALLRKAFADV